MWKKAVQQSVSYGTEKSHVGQRKKSNVSSGTPEVFEKYLQAFANILELLQIQKKYLGPLGTPGVFEEYLEALENNLELL